MNLTAGRDGELLGDGHRPARETALVVAAAIVMQAIVWALLLFLFQVHHVFYGFHDISDTSLYLDYAQKMAGGQAAYSVLKFEYPPLAVPLLRLPGHLADLNAYQRWFSYEMIAVCAAAAAFTAAAAAQLWRGLSRPLATAAAFAAAVGLTGAITANRYDAAVALVIALFAYLLARRSWVLAAAALGLGFALKLTPALLLPLVFVLAVRPRRVLAAAVAFGAAALLPFVPYLVTGGHGLMYIFTYHAQRPLQIESLLATPFAIGHAFGFLHFDAASTFGSQGIPGEGARLAATISPWLTLLAVGLVYLFIWRRRHYLRAVPAAVPLAALALVLAFVCTSKVLSPQFMIWTFPLVALVAVGSGRGQRMLGALSLLAMLLTQVEFPAYYWSFVAFHRVPVMIVTLRNVTLLAAGVLAAVLVWRLPAVAGLGAREPGAIGRAGVIDYDAPALEAAPRRDAPAATHSQPEVT